MSRVIDFYLYDATTESGHRLEQIWEWPHKTLEGCHDYIQWMFPTDQPSQFNADAPLIDSTDIRAFEVFPQLRPRLKKSFEVFLDFLGLRWDDGTVALAPNFNERKEVFEGVNHNWLRITRVIRSLSLLGLRAEATAFYNFLEHMHKTCGVVSEETMRFWGEAVSPASNESKPIPV